ncbi:uncharacterized protein LOC111070984 [Drosophila obscura]|uniref:uncharacterized protein LOC111070984 n=1 Tax=Drosophila obscura TaxID=7282 RepID=UPI001BB15EB6|nr:uncharacterized protein LOC111070984 [Drosophila obscura]XP_022217746.2 uncharacterized protein LOC111070984 [Drosophila obscura]
MRLYIVVFVPILMGLAFTSPLEDFMGYLKDFQPLEKINTPDGSSHKINETNSMLNNSQLMDEPKPTHIVHIHPLKHPLKTYLKRIQQNIEEKLQKEMLPNNNKPQQVSLPPLFVVDMIQPVVTYEPNKTINKVTADNVSSLSPKLSYIRLMRVLIEHIWLTASETPKEAAAASTKETPKLTNNTIM